MYGTITANAAQKLGGVLSKTKRGTKAGQLLSKHAAKIGSAVGVGIAGAGLHVAATRGKKQPGSKGQRLGKFVGESIGEIGTNLRHPLRAVKSSVAGTVAKLAHPIKTSASGFTTAGVQSRRAILRKGGRFHEYVGAHTAGIAPKAPKTRGGKKK